MSIFVSAQSANRTTRALYWPETAATPSCDAPRVVDPAEFIETLRAQHSVQPVPDLLLRARSTEANARWWPHWVFDEPRLRAHIGARVLLTESTRLYGARFVWVGVPFPGLVPTPENALPTSDCQLNRCMVSLATHGPPRDKHAYIWCVVNADGDVIELSRDVLRALLAPEIAELKTFVKRGGTMATSSGDTTTDYVAAAQLMAMSVSGIPGVEENKLLPFMATPGAPPPDNLTAVPTTALKNRRAVLETMRRSIQKKLSAGEAIVNPLCAGDGVSRELVLDVMRYIIHYGQFDPTIKDVLREPPHADDMAAIMRDPAFVAAIRVCGDLFYQPQ